MLLQPKEKPLRTKRGHRKPSFLTNLDSSRGPSSTFVPNNQAMTLSPSNSDAFSHTQTAAPRPAVAATNGTKPPAASETPRRPRNAFELFVNENRSVLQAQMPKDGNHDVDKELAMKWRDMGFEGQHPYYQRLETGDLEGSGSAKKGQDARDEDVEMGEDGEDEEEA
jgi:non-histone protein 10